MEFEGREFDEQNHNKNLLITDSEILNESVKKKKKVRVTNARATQTMSDIQCADEKRRRGSDVFFLTPAFLWIPQESTLILTLVQRRSCGNSLNSVQIIDRTKELEGRNVKLSDFISLTH